MRQKNLLEVFRLVYSRNWQKGIFKIIPLTMILIGLFIQTHAQISVTIEYTSPQCAGYGTANATAHASGGTAPYTYHWSNGQNSQSAFGLTPGLVTVTVTDANYQNASQSVSIESPEELVVNLNGADGDCYSGDNSLSADAIGGTPPYTYQWSNGNTSSVLSSPPSGFYFVTVTDSKGCFKVEGKNVAGQMTPIIETNSVSCFGACDGSIGATVEGGVGPYTYQWNNGMFPNAPIQVVADVGMYVITITDANGCTAVGSAELTQPPIIEAQIVMDDPCSGTTSANVSAVGGIPPYTYKWSNGHYGQNHPYLTSGQHKVTVTDAANCHQEFGIWVSESDMALSVSTQQADCFGGSTGSATAIAVGSGGNHTYKWSNGQEGAHATDLAPGSYTVTATDLAGCEKEESFDIVSSTGLEAELYPTMIDCDGNGGTTNIAVVGGTPPYEFNWSDGQTTQMAVNMNPGTYTVEISDVNGCTGAAEVVMEEMNTIEASMIQVNPSLCAATGGNATVSVTGGAQPYTYQWNGQYIAEPTKDNLSAGMNTLVVWDANGCKETIEFEVEDQTMEVMVEVMNEGCPGESNASAQAHIMGGGSGPFTYKWSNGLESQISDGLNVGWHAVTVTDASGCEEVLNVEVVGVPEMQIAVDITPTACEGAETGAATANVVNGGTAPYTYKWGNSANSASIGGLAQGEYQLTVTDANGCEKEVMILVPEESFELAVDVTNPDCADAAEGIAQGSVISGGTAPYTYTWSNGLTGQTINNLTPGSYSLVVSDVNGCESLFEFDVNANSNLEAEFAFGTADCDDNGVYVAFTDMSAAASQGTAPVSWQWNFSNGETSTEQNPQIWVTGSSVTAELIVTDALGCSKAYSDVVEVNSIDVSVAPEAQGCHGQEMQLEAIINNNASDLVFDWGPDNMIMSGDGTPNPVINTNQAGQFTIELSIQNSSGCSLESAILVEIGETVPMNEAAISYKQCSNLTVDFINENTADVSCIWYFDYPNNMSASSTEASPSHTYSQPGEYMVALVALDDCHEPIYMNVAVDAAPTPAIASETENCQEEVTVQFTDMSIIQEEIQSWHWDFGPFGTSNEQNPSLTFTESEVVEATLTIEFGEEGCTASVTDLVQVNIFNPPTLQDQWFSCNGLEVELNPDGTTNYAYLWAVGGSATISNPNAVNPIATLTETTNFMVTITDLAGSNGCESIQQVTVEVPDNILAISDIADVTLCEEVDVTLTAELTAPASIQWSTDEDFSNVISTDASISVLTAEPTTYYVMATDANGCTVTEQALVANLSSVVAFDQAFNICQGYTMEWPDADIDPATITGWSPYNPLETPVMASEAFTFSVDIGQECPAYGSFELTVTDFEFTYMIEAEPDTLLQGEFTELSVTENPAFTYNWSPSNGLSSTNSPNPSAQPLQTTEYTVKVIDTETQCEGEAKINIIVEDVVCEEPYIFVPNAFTPNADGVNDKLYVRGFNIDEVYFAVYDRWGERVFETDDLEKGWDGKFNGHVVSGDVYGYYLKAVCYGGEKFFKKGNVTVLR